MVPAFLRETLAGEALLALGVAAVSTFAAWLTVLVITGFLGLLIRRTRTSLDDLLLAAVARSLFLLLSLVGVYVALTGMNVLDPYQRFINQGFLVLVLVLLVYTLNRVALALLTWYESAVAPRTAGPFDQRTIPVVRRIVTVIILVLGGLTIVRALGLDISPVLAGLGIGGLAVALAVQPTLSNLIAGAYAISEGRIGVGDYIRLQDGSEGVVQDIGWRTTKLLTPHATIIVVPNARLADSIVTNYSAGGPGSVTILQCGIGVVGAVSEMQRRVEAAARATLERLPDDLPDAPPVVLFRGLADGRADFEVLLHVQVPASRHRIASTFLEELQARFPTEGVPEDAVRRFAYVPGGATRIQ